MTLMAATHVKKVGMGYQKVGKVSMAWAAYTSGEAPSMLKGT